jgi:hypothetical protein
MKKIKGKRRKLKKYENVQSRQQNINIMEDLIN